MAEQRMNRRMFLKGAATAAVGMMAASCAQPTPIVIEKEVPRVVDRIVLIPRWGIRSPTYVNSLIRQADRGIPHQPDNDHAVDVTSNVTLLSKKAH